MSVSSTETREVALGVGLSASAVDVAAAVAAASAAGATLAALVVLAGSGGLCGGEMWRKGLALSGSVRVVG